MPSNDNLSFIARNAPNAFALLKGSVAYPALRARVEFYQTNKGVLVLTEAYNLPDKENKGFGVFAFHIHSGENCTKYGDDPFAGAEVHFNPTDALHPYHAGDLPPLFSNNGYAFDLFLTDRFNVRSVINKAMIIHLKPDDFTSQPSGNSGTKIACGIIKPYNRLSNRF